MHLVLDGASSYRSYEAFSPEMDVLLDHLLVNNCHIHLSLPLERHGVIACLVMKLCVFSYPLLSHYSH